MSCPHFFHPQITSILIALCALNFWTGCSEKNELGHLPVEAQVEAGLDALRIFDFQSAYEILSVVQPELSTSSEQWVFATYALGLAAWHKTPPSPDAVEEAKSLFQSVVEQSPESECAASALLDLGRIAEISDYLGEATDVAAAQVYYQKVREQFPGTDMSARATVLLAQTMAQSFEPTEVTTAIELLNAEMEAQPDSPWLGTMAQYEAQLHAFYKHDYAASLEPYETAMDAGFPRSSEADVSLWQMGLLAEEAGEDFIAARVFSRLVKNYPRSIYGTVARERIIQIAANHPEAEIEIPELSKLGLGR